MSETFGVGAAFDAFKNRGRRGVLTGAAIAYAIGTILIIGAFMALSWRSVAALGAAYYEFFEAAAQGEPPADPNDPRFAALMQAIGGLAGVGIVLLFAVYLLLAAFEAAVHRWLVRGEAGGGILGLNLGADTWRVYLCYWVWFFVYIGLAIAVGIVSGLLGAGLGAAMAGSGSDSGAMVGVIVAIQFAAMLVMLYILLRLAPGAAVTVGLKRFAYFQAWTATRGKFWPMLGAYLILIVLYIVVYCVLFAIGAATVLGPVSGAFAQGAPPDAATFLAALAQPATVIVLSVLYLLLGVIGMVFFVAFMGINAAVARTAIAEGRLGAPPAAAAAQPAS